MKLYRYCSTWEYENFIAGRPFRNERPCFFHVPPMAVFWFFPVKDMTLQQIKDNLHQLSDIVTAERLIIIEVADDYFAEHFTPDEGRYIARGTPDYDWSCDNLEMCEEYYVEEYSKSVAKLLGAYAIDYDAFLFGKKGSKIFTKLELKG